MIQGSGLRVDHGVSAEFSAVGPGSSFPIAAAECLSPPVGALLVRDGLGLPLSWGPTGRRPAADEPDPAILTLALPALAAPATPVVSPSARGGGRGDLAGAHLEKAEPFSVEWQLPLATRP